MFLLSELFNLGLFKLAITFSSPLLIAATGELLTERSGVLNVAIEGIMIMGAVVGFMVTNATGSALLGLTAAMAAGGVFGIILAIFSVNLKASQLIVGLGLLVLALGLSSLLYRLIFGVRLLVPQIQVLSPIAIPILSRIPLTGEVLFNQNFLVYLGYVLVPAMAFVLHKTPIGLRIRACGENPRAVDVLGINVFKIRFVCTIIGSMIIGIAGAYLPLVLTGTFSEGLVGGRGWLALQLVIFGRWMPHYILVGALFFAYIEALQFRWAMVMQSIPSQVFLMLPYIFAIIALIWVYKQAESPQSLMKPYDREQR